MNERPRALPKASIEKSRFSVFLWLIPLAAALLCAWYLCRDVLFGGPVITIYFQDAEGLQEQISLVQYRGAQIGEVQTLQLTKDRQHVAVKARLDAAAAGLAQQGAVFWIVRPELKLGSVSGLRTIVLGNYITLQPGDGPPTNIFTGAENEPIAPIPALDFLLLSSKLDALQPSSPVFYRGIQVGEVMDCRLGDDARNVVIHARIRQNYAALVRKNSKFWNAGGVNFHIGLFSGAKITAESAQTLVNGGVAFATPTDYQEAATNGAVFSLNEKTEAEWEKWSPAIALPGEPAAMTNKGAWPDLKVN